MASAMSHLRPVSRDFRCARPKKFFQTLTSLLELPPKTTIPRGVTLTFQRYASHAQQGSVNGPKNGPGPRLGAKKSGGQYVIPGNIIFRQRGTLWFPGTNCGMGRDHTIYALQAGYVNYYRNPAVHPKRKYIGVAFERNHSLPYPPNAPRHRRLGMVAVPMASASSLVDGEGEGEAQPPTVQTASVPSATQDKEEASPDQAVQRKAAPTLVTIRPTKKGQPVKTLHLRPNYSYREGNWEIGRAAERANVKVREYQRGDRFLAWRKTAARKAKNVERRGLMKRSQGPKKPKKIRNRN